MSHKCKPPKSVKKIVKQMPLPPPQFRLGPPSASGETASKIIGKIAAEGNFSSIDEINAHLQRLLASGELNRMIQDPPETPAERAQELAYRAMEEPSNAKARKLAERALKLDPDCVDALVIRAQTRRSGPEEFIADLRAAVEAGERSLGKQKFIERRGHFWGFLETRPYMRARRELAMALLGAGQFREAATEFAAMLELNPNDNQGVRDYLLGVYLALDDLDGAASLYRQYGDDGATFVWGRVFLLMLNGQRAEAKNALEKAFQNNPWTAQFFFGERPPNDPDSWVMGDDPDEGDHAAAALLPASTEHPDIIVWIAKEGLKVMKALMASDSARGPRRVH